MDTTKALEIADKIDLATPGKWSIPKMGNGQWIYAGKLLENDPGFIRGGNQVAVTDDSDLDRKQRKANAKAICIARNEAPAMLRAQSSQIAQLTAENERLTRVVEQAIGFAGLEIDEDGFLWSEKAAASENAALRNIPDLFAQLKGADRG
jgi:hypothetical protein